MEIFQFCVQNWELFFLVKKPDLFLPQVVQNANKDVKNLEKDLLKAAKTASKYNKKAADFTNLISGKDKDEKELRDKLVTKLKEKEIEKMKECGEKLRDNSFYITDDDEMEDISEDELSVSRVCKLIDE